MGLEPATLQFESNAISTAPSKIFITEIKILKSFMFSGHLQQWQGLATLHGDIFCNNGRALPPSMEMGPAASRGGLAYPRMTISNAETRKTTEGK